MPPSQIADQVVRANYRGDHRSHQQSADHDTQRVDSMPQRLDLAGLVEFDRISGGGTERYDRRIRVLTFGFFDGATVLVLGNSRPPPNFLIRTQNFLRVPTHVTSCITNLRSL